MSGSNCSSTSAPVRYFNGQNLFSVTELTMPGLQGWYHSRSHTADPNVGDSALGRGWASGGNLKLFQNPDQSIVVLKGSVPFRSFSRTGSAYVPRSWYQDTLVWDQVSHQFLLTDIDGRQWRFTDWVSPGLTGPGVLTQFSDRDGSLTTFVFGSSGVTAGRLLELQQTDAAVPTSFNKFTYNYYLSGMPAGLLSNVTLTRTVAGVSTMVRKVDYTYYNSSANGPLNALQYSKISDASGLIDAYYYRYYGGAAPLLKYVLGPTSYARALKALSTDAAIDAASDTTLAPWALYYFEYDFATQRVTKEVVQGQGCGCGTGGGKGTFTYSTRRNPSTAFPGEPNVWVAVTTEVLPDLNTNDVYTNAFGETMAEVFRDTSTGQQWIMGHQYDEKLREVVRIEPSGISGVLEGNPWLISNNLQPGLYHFHDFYASTNLALGQVAGYRSGERVGNSATGPTIPLKTIKYTSRTGATGTVYPGASETVYRNADGTGALTTTFSYTWQGTSNRIQQLTTTYPLVPAAQNGSATAATKTLQFDTYDRMTWRRDEDGFIFHTQYDNLSGGVTLSISDVNTASVTNEPAGWATPAGGGLHLTATYGVDALGRITKETEPDGRTNYKVYKDAAHEIRSYPGWNSATNVPTGPTQVIREDRANSYREMLTMSAAPAVLSGAPTGTEAVSGLQSLDRSYFDTGDRIISQDSYFNFSGLAYSTNPNIGTLGTHFYRSSFNYDLAGRRDRSVDWTGTIRRSFHDSRGRVQSQWIGTDDTPTTGDWSPSNLAGTNMTKVRAFEYDSNLIGNGNLTKSRYFTTPSASLDVVFQYDFRNRMVNRRRADLVARNTTYDNLDRATIVQLYADANANFVIEAAELRDKLQTNFDDRGRVYQSVTFKVDPSTGAIGNSLTENVWSDGRGSTIKFRGANGQFQKFQRDGVGRHKAAYRSFDDAEASYADAWTVANDTVIEQDVFTYDGDEQVIQTTQYRRTGGTAKLGDLSVGWSPNDSRRTFTAEWHDNAERLIAVGDYGTNGGVALSRPATPPAPGSAGVLVTTFAYDAGGRRFQVRDNLNRLQQSSFDGLGRVTQVVENFSGSGVPVETDFDSNRTTLMTYDSAGRPSTVVAKNPKGSGAGVQSQTTRYIYGTVANQAAPAIYRNDLQVAELYPDSDDTYTAGGAAGSQLGNGADAAYDRVEWTYDLSSRIATIKDHRGVLRTHGYDSAGRLFTDAVTTLPSGVDGTVLRRQYGYDSLSRLLTATSYNAASGGTVVNQVKYTYDGYWNATKREDAHVGAVLSGTTPAVQVAFADGGAGGIAKYVRQSSTTYPNGRVVFLNYPASGVGAKLSRLDNLSSVANDPHSGTTTPYAVYEYLGASDIMDVNHPEITSLGAAGLVFRQGPDTNPGAWDAFDRRLFTKWRNTANTNTLDQRTYSYDAAGNRLTSQVASTTLPPAGSEKDEAYTYDGLNRVTKENRGLLSAGTITDASRKFGQAWTLESVGNWRQLQAAPTGGATYGLVQNRSHNAVNEIDTNANDADAAGASISGSGGGDWIDPTQDKAGNLKSGPKAGAEATRQWFSYDAWNRLVKVQADSAGAPGATVAEYQYDAQGWRTVKLLPNGANWDRTDYYYNFDWQCVEERKTLNVVGKTTVAATLYAQYVWDARYIDAPVKRWRDSNGDGTLDEEMYYCQDANGNTTAIVNKASGAVAERYVYDAYGKATTLTAAWGAPGTTLKNEILFAGYRLDPETSLHLARNRYYHSSLGRWLQRDPLRYVAGMNLSQYVRSNPVSLIDPYGLEELFFGPFNDPKTGTPCGWITVHRVAPYQKKDNPNGFKTDYVDLSPSADNDTQEPPVGAMVFRFTPSDTCSCCKNWGWIQHIKEPENARGKDWRYDNGAMDENNGIGKGSGRGAPSDPKAQPQPTNPKDPKQNPWYGGEGDAKNPKPSNRIGDKPSGRADFVTQLTCVETGQVVFNWEWSSYGGNANRGTQSEDYPPFKKFVEPQPRGAGGWNK